MTTDLSSCAPSTASSAMPRRPSLHTVFDAELNFVSADENTSFCEAEHEESWRQAMMEEMKAIEDNRTW
jgi:hypothetical protein